MTPSYSRTPRSRSGQSATEQALLIAAVAAALMGMQVYLRLAVQGRLHTARTTLLGRETPFYSDGGGAARTREYQLNVTETVTSTPEHPLPVVDPLRGLDENRVLTHYTATTEFTETTVTR